MTRFRRSGQQQRYSASLYIITLALSSSILNASMQDISNFTALSNSIGSTSMEFLVGIFVLRIDFRSS